MILGRGTCPLLRLRVVCHLCWDRSVIIGKGDSLPTVALVCIIMIAVCVSIVMVRFTTFLIALFGALLGIGHRRRLRGRRFVRTIKLVRVAIKFFHIGILTIENPIVALGFAAFPLVTHRAGGGLCACLGRSLTLPGLPFAGVGSLPLPGARREVTSNQSAPFVGAFAL